MAKKEKPVYLIVLEGQGDTYTKLVGPALWEWINSDPPDFTDGNGLAAERLTDEAFAEQQAGDWFDPDDQYSEGGRVCHVTCGSWDNDRALFACGKDFVSIKQMMAWCKKTGAVIEDEYHGCIY
jgi:hypothetical protein